MGRVNCLTYFRRTLLLCCFPVLTVVGANLILLGLPQARETLEAFDHVKGEGSIWSDKTYWIFMLALAYWSTAAWYCSRLLLGKRYRFDTVGQCVCPHFATLVRTWLPRLLGMLSVVPITTYFWVCGWRAGLGIAPAVFAMGFLGFVAFRRHFLRL